MSILSTSTHTTEGDSLDPGDKRDWRAAMRSAIRDIGPLLQLLQLPADSSVATQAASDQFPVFVPLEYLSRIQPGNPDDPLLRQVLPIAEETSKPPGFARDPLEERRAAPEVGLLQKYPGRALLVTTGTCPVHCRYCFRRHFAYEHLPQGRQQWQPVIGRLCQSPDITEVLFSGGDPLSLGDELLDWLFTQIAAIEHVKRIRIHTRFPIMIPQRVTPGLIKTLKRNDVTTLVVVHANHANELDDAVTQSIGRIVDAGVQVFNQSVLLRGVNDSVEAMFDLCEALINCRVLPYYLHLLDRVDGAAHFEVDEIQGREIIADLRAKLPGYAVPRLVREVPGESSKTIVV